MKKHTFNHIQRYNNKNLSEGLRRMVTIQFAQCVKLTQHAEHAF